MPMLEMHEFHEQSPDQPARVLCDGPGDALSVQVRVKRELPRVSPERPHKRVFSGLRPFSMTMPKSAFAGATNGIHISNEADALANLPDTPSQPYTMIDLEDFTVYRDPRASLRPYEMSALHALRFAHGAEELFLDGYLCISGERYAVQRVKFDTLAISGYGTPRIPSIRAGISVQSKEGARLNVWYRLKKPSPEYLRYHEPFLWVADLAKHVIDFILVHEAVGLAHFRSEFYEWLLETYGKRRCLENWLKEYRNQRDFRQAVVANMHYLWKEAYDVVENCDRHPLWSEADPAKLSAIPVHTTTDSRTITTPFVFNIFQDMPFNAILVRGQRVANVHANVVERRKLLGLTPLSIVEVGVPDLELRPMWTVSPGDVVHIRPDENTRWRTSEETWLARVQAVRHLKNGRTKLDLIWLYRPSDTSIGESYYPIRNELFMSDNCSCGKEAYDLDRVLGKAEVIYGLKDPAKALQHNSYIIRQTYLSNDHEFVTFHEGHLTCTCDRTPLDPFQELMKEYNVGDFVLLRPESFAAGNRLLEPAQLAGFITTTKTVRLRLLQRARLLKPRSRVNELLWTTEYVEIPPENVVRRCKVQGFRDPAMLPEEFDRGGLGDFFFYISDSDHPEPEGGVAKDADDTIPRLTGMGICCGGGSFDRGLEDGHAVDFRHAIDFDPAAMHTYRANSSDTAQLFLGPMELYLKRALQSQTPPHSSIADVGTIGVMAAGSPCKSFSVLQGDKKSPRSMKHASLVACVLSYVEHYMPLYFYLENVVAISSTEKGGREDQNMMRKIIATLVGLGYQVQQHVLDAPSYSSFQSRRRVILTATAPGLVPTSRPPTSHVNSPVDGIFRSTSLGKLSNGERLGTNQDELAPFETVTFYEGTKDLPDIGDGHVFTCIPFPDHRQGGTQCSAEQRHVMKMIPQYPRGMGLATAHARGKIAKPQFRRWLEGNPRRLHPSSKSFTRVRPDSTIGTVTCVCAPLDSFSGGWLHPSQDRMLTVMEVRRAQGFPDSEVIIGRREDQWRIVGNAVNRDVATALGLSLRDAWRKSYRDGNGLVQHVDAMVPARQTEGPPATVTKTDMRSTSDEAPTGFRNGGCDLGTAAESRAKVTATSTPVITVTRLVKTEIWQSMESITVTEPTTLTWA